MAKTRAGESVARLVTVAVVFACVAVPAALVLVVGLVSAHAERDAAVSRAQALAAQTATLLAVYDESGSLGDLDVARAFVRAAVPVAPSTTAALAVRGVAAFDPGGAPIATAGDVDRGGIVVDATLIARDRSGGGDVPAGRVVVAVAPPAVPWRAVALVAVLGAALAALVATMLLATLRQRALTPLSRVTAGLAALARRATTDANGHLDAARDPRAEPVVEVQALLDAADALVRAHASEDALAVRLAQGQGRAVANDASALSRRPERKDASVLVVDVRDFTPLLASLGPDDAVRLTDALLRTFVGVVERYGGHVERFLPDGVVALFGAPEPQSDHAARAVACAVDLEGESARLVEQLMATGVPRFVVGVGVASGTCIVGAVGPESRRMVQAMGEVPALARAVQREAKSQTMTVLVTAAAWRAAAGDARLAGVQPQPLPPTVVRGVGMPLDLVRLTRPPRARDEVTALVGRAD